MDSFIIGKGIIAESAAERRSHIKLTAALGAEYVGGLWRDVYVQYYTPVLSELAKTADHVPAEESQSISSQQYYNGTIASRSSSLGAGSFTALLTDGITDAILTRRNKVTTVKFWPDRNKSTYILTQGALGVARTHPVAAQAQAAVTMAAENASADFLS